MQSPSPKIIILTAPSGSGKTTLAQYLLAKYPELDFSVSATTRAPRQHEANGINYYFYNENEFQQLITEGKLLEYQEVYPGQFYGTLNAEVDRICSAGKTALFDIDVKGAYNLEQSNLPYVLSVYIKTSSLDVLRQRLIARGTESSESIEKRLFKAKEELEYAKYFDYVITNDRLELAQKMISVLVEDFLAR